MRYLIPILFLLASLPVPAGAGEADYADPWCLARGGRVEVVLSDRTRADCLTEEFAIEADFARKWYQSIGQAMHYARLTGKRPGVLLILEKPEDKRYLERMKKAKKDFDIDLTVWSIGP